MGFVVDCVQLTRLLLLRMDALVMKQVGAIKVISNGLKLED
jgi:hypothetical protein